MIFLYVLGSVSTGLVYDGKFDAEKYFALIQAYQVNVLCCTPTEYRFMSITDDLDTKDLSSLTHAVSAGEPLNPEVIEVFEEKFGIDVRDGYGDRKSVV